MLKHLSTGPELPYRIWFSAMAPSPDGDGVILVGGFGAGGILGSGNELDSIIELKADGQGWVGHWTTLSTTLQYARYAPVVIPVLMHSEN